MSCNCGCHDDKPPATGWRRYVPVIVGVGVLAAIIAGAFLRKDGTQDRGSTLHAPKTTARTP